MQVVTGIQDLVNQVLLEKNKNGGSAYQLMGISDQFSPGSEGRNQILLARVRGGQIGTGWEENGSVEQKKKKKRLFSDRHQRVEPEKSIRKVGIS